MVASDEISVRNGRDLAANILNHPQGGLDVLLDFTENQENEWIEYKAALRPRNGIFEQGQNEGDYRWHVARAVIAMANWVGGAVILGIDDQGTAVGLKPSDTGGILAHEGREAFNRKVLAPAITGPKWKTGRLGLLGTGDHFERLIEIHNATYQGLPVAIVLISPVEADESIEICQVNKDRHLIYTRARGARGQIVELRTHKEKQTHIKMRQEQLQSPTWQHLWKRFQHTCEAPVVDNMSPVLTPAVEQALQAWCQQIAEQLFRLKDRFTPLLAEADKPQAAAPHIEPEVEAVLDLFASDSPYRSLKAASETDRLHHRPAYSSDGVALEHSAQPQRGNLFELLAQTPRALLLGEPGAGKSTCLKQLTLEGATRYAAGGILPLYVPLRRFTGAGLQNLLAQAARQPWPMLAALIQQHRLRLLLDAVNECPRHLQTRCCQEISELLADYPNLPLILSSRVTPYPCHLNLSAYILRPLNRTQQQHFLTACLGDAEKACKLLERLHELPGGARMAGSPIFLRMVEQVGHHHKDLPRGHALLYRRFLADWFTREQNKETSTGAVLRWSYPVTLEALGKLAFDARQAGLVSLPLHQALQFLQPLLLEDSHPFIERMAQGLLLNLEADHTVLSFIHESIQEYLAAEYLICCPNALKALPNPEEAGWRMPVLYREELLQQP